MMAWIAVCLIYSAGLGTTNPPRGGNATAKARSDSATRAIDGKDKGPNGRGAIATGKSPADRPPVRWPRNLAVKAMKRVIEDAEIVNMTLGEFAEWLARATGANVVVRWGVLESAGVERDRVISLKRKHIRLRKLLPLVFDRFTKDLPAVELAARADGNTLILSTRKDIHTKRITRVYEVRDLLIAIPQFKGRRIGSLGLGEEGAFRLGEDRSKRDRSAIRNPRVRRLITLITTHIQPLSWKDRGGKGTIRYFKGRLVVRNNIEVHQQLGGGLGKTGLGHFVGGMTTD